MQRPDRDLITKKGISPVDESKIKREPPWDQFNKAKFEKGKYLRHGKPSNSDLILQSEKLPFVKDGQANHRNWGERITLE